MPFDPPTKVIGKQFIELDHAESTNKTTAEMHARNELRHGAVILAHDQRAGQGQRGRSWHCAPGLDLAFSVYVRPAGLKADRQFVLGRIAALAVHALVQAKGKDEVRIKWPNDILVGRHKIAGMLIQNEVLGERLIASIIGIGLNVNNTDLHAALLATSLKIVTGEDHDRMALIGMFCGFFEEYYERWSKGDDLSAFYTEKLWGLGRWMDVLRDGERTKARLMDVDGIGRAIVELEDGTVEALGSDRISFLREPE